MSEVTKAINGDNVICTDKQGNLTEIKKADLKWVHAESATAKIVINRRPCRAATALTTASLIAGIILATRRATPPQRSQPTHLQPPAATPAALGRNASRTPRPHSPSRPRPQCVEFPRPIFPFPRTAAVVFVLRFTKSNRNKCGVS